MSWGIYVHVPWCRVRCPYCAFYVRPDRDADVDAYVDAVLREYRARAPAFNALGPPRSLYFGGGTPSRLPLPALARLIRGLQPSGSPDAICLEANPEDIDDDWLAGVIDLGVRRVSVGIQTFDRRFARLLNRRHSVDQARQTVQRVARAPLQSWSVDVIFALPGQRLEDLEVDIDAILETHPPHVSLYGLTFEPGTGFARGLERGRLEAPDPDRWRAMYDLLVERLSAAGLQRYEVSNFARPGHESIHNQLYWTDAPYLGLGPSAHGYGPDRSRWSNRADLSAWQEDPIGSSAHERPSPEQAATDLLLATLRARSGVPLGRLEALGFDLDGLEQLSAWLKVHTDRVCLTDAGFPLADGVLAVLLDHLTPRH